MTQRNKIIAVVLVALAAVGGIAVRPQLSEPILRALGIATAAIVTAPTLDDAPTLVHVESDGGVTP